MRSFDIYNLYLKSIGLLGGESCIVEIDETKIGKNKHNRGHVITGFWAVGMI